MIGQDSLYVFHLTQMRCGDQAIGIDWTIRVSATSLSSASDGLLKQLEKGGYGNWTFDFELTEIIDS